jgi:hypothetical protein|tara:strand:- start:2256 stop:2423 length:168 start_codon:yes stop_codon:yes gene_type:complete
VDGRVEEQSSGMAMASNEESTVGLKIPPGVVKRRSCPFVGWARVEVNSDDEVVNA